MYEMYRIYTQDATGMSTKVEYRKKLSHFYYTTWLELQLKKD